MLIPFNDLKRNFKIFQSELEAKAIDVLRSGWYVLGKECEAFENEFSRTLGVRYCIGVDNGLNAIKLGCHALGIGPGDEVIVQANTYIATVLGITLNGATPIFVEPNIFYNIDCDHIIKNITSRTKAVLVTHLYGQASDMTDISLLCKKYNLYLLEDCAQSHFAKFNNQYTGTFGIMGFFSFYPTKNLGAIGDAGCVVTDDENLADKIRVLRNYGSKERYHNIIEGYNARLDEIQAAFLRVKLKYIEKITHEREAIANQYLQRISNPKILLPKIAVGATHVWYLFVIQVEERNAFRKFLSDNGITTDVHYPIPPHLSEAYKGLGYTPGSFPFTEKLASSVVSIPLFNGLLQEEIDYVIKVVNEYGT